MTIYPFVAAGTEAEVLLSTLERNRATFAWKCGGLDAAAVRTTLAPSSITLGGLLKHLALCEDHYFTHQLRGDSMPDVWHDADGGNPFDADPDWEWHSAAENSPEELMAIWTGAVDRSRRAVDAALAEGDLGQPLRETSWSTPPDMRRMVVDMIEEYARHTGHADLIRESIDGLTGEGLPLEE
jgi:hypothetical protein